MSQTHSPRERRRARRVQVKAAGFIIQNGQYRGSYHVSNLSVTGVGLVGRHPVRPGEAVELVLQIGGLPSLQIHAVGVHCTGPSPYEYIIGLSFADAMRETEDILQNVVAAAVA